MTRKLFGRREYFEQLLKEHSTRQFLNSAERVGSIATELDRAPNSARLHSDGRIGHCS